MLWMLLIRRRIARKVANVILDYGVGVPLSKKVKVLLAGLSKVML